MLLSAAFMPPPALAMAAGVKKHHSTWIRHEQMEQPKNTQEIPRVNSQPPRLRKLHTMFPFMEHEMAPLRRTLWSNSFQFEGAWLGMFVFFLCLKISGNLRTKTGKLSFQGWSSVPVADGSWFSTWVWHGPPPIPTILAIQGKSRSEAVGKGQRSVAANNFEQLRNKHA